MLSEFLLSFASTFLGMFFGLGLVLVVDRANDSYRDKKKSLEQQHRNKK